MTAGTSQTRQPGGQFAASPDTPKVAPRSEKPRRTTRLPAQVMDARREQRRARAEKCRAALKRLLTDAGLTTHTLSLKAGMATGNSISNFFSGSSDSLNYPTVLQLAAVLPEIGPLMLPELFPVQPARDPSAPASLAAELAAVHPGPAVQQSLAPARDRSLDRLGVHIRYEARAGKRTAYGRLPTDKQLFVGMPLTRAWAQEAAFAVVVRTPGAEEIYRDGTTLLCLPPSKHLDEIRPGRRVLVVSTVMTRAREARTEVTVREVARHKGKLVLRLRSGGLVPPGHDGLDEPMPSNYAGGPWDAGKHQLSIAGLVVAACQPEG